jgi:acyl homoserine lactone synthase
MKIFTGTAETLPAGMLLAMARYRHQVFVERLGWTLQSHAGMEFDQFDRRDTVYVVACDPQARVIGTARLLPTHRPYLLAEVFPELLGDAPAPRTPLVWEISRFAAVKLEDDKARSTMFSTSLSLDLLRAAMAVARSAGARRLISVSPVGIERILRRGGFRIERAAAPLCIDGQALFACWLELQPCAQPVRCDRRQAGSRSYPASP